jgi:hypothetical protein
MSATKLFLVVPLLVLSACASNPAPKGALPREEYVDRTGYGGWIYVERNAGPAVQGELLAASNDSILVLTANGLHAVGRDAISLAEVGVFEARMGGLTAWMVVGTLSTISNGFFLIFTAPMWLIGGGFSLARLSRQPIYDWRIKDQMREWNVTESLSSLARFARFPGGIPDNVDRSALTSPMLMRQ